ncbi:MAG TPA: hypothetical protein ENI79_00160, partial [Rhodospirillales bacterium]|nr:hypothetical protein [Rhodospirillales bacterium]
MNIIVPDTPSQSAGGDAPVFVLEAADTDAVLVPGEDFIQTAEYARSGPDLLLTGADGKTVLVRDYFNLENPPDLTDVKGAV